MNFRWISDQIDLLSMQWGDQFLGHGRDLLHSLAIIVLIVYGAKWTIASFSGHHHTFDVPALISLFTKFIIAEFILSYWNVQLPWVSCSIPEILPRFANDLVQYMNDRSVALVADKFKAAIDSLQDNEPGPFLLNIWSWWVYALSLLTMYGAEAVMMAVNIVGYLAIGVGTLLGPLMVPWMIVPGQPSQLLWKLVWFFVEFSMWRVVATAVTFVWSGAWAAFLDQAVRGDYSIEHFAMLVPYMLVFTIGMFWSIFYVSRFTSDLFKGTATGGSNFGTSIAILARAFA